MVIRVALVNDDEVVVRGLDAMLRKSGWSNVVTERRFAGWGVFETMNYRYTHAPGNWRARSYEGVLRVAGAALASRVQRAGRADAILCVGFNSH